MEANADKDLLNKVCNGRVYKHYIHILLYMISSTTIYMLYRAILQVLIHLEIL